MKLHGGVKRAMLSRTDVDAARATLHVAASHATQRSVHKV